QPREHRDEPPAWYVAALRQYREKAAERGRGRGGCQRQFERMQHRVPDPRRGQCALQRGDADGHARGVRIEQARHHGLHQHQYQRQSEQQRKGGVDGQRRCRPQYDRARPSRYRGPPGEAADDRRGFEVVVLRHVRQPDHGTKLSLYHCFHSVSCAEAVLSSSTTNGISVLRPGLAATPSMTGMKKKSVSSPFCMAAWPSALVMKAMNFSAASICLVLALRPMLAGSATEPSEG